MRSLPVSATVPRPPTSGKSRPFPVAGRWSADHVTGHVLASLNRPVVGYADYGLSLPPLAGQGKEKANYVSPHLLYRLNDWRRPACFVRFRAAANLRGRYGARPPRRTNHQDA